MYGDIPPKCGQTYGTVPPFQDPGIPVEMTVDRENAAQQVLLIQNGVTINVHLLY